MVNLSAFLRQLTNRDDSIQQPVQAAQITDVATVPTTQAGGINAFNQGLHRLGTGLNTGLNSFGRGLKTLGGNITGAASTLGGNIANGLLGTYQPTALMQYQDELRNKGFDDATVNGVAQGLNFGNKDIATKQQQLGIAIPQGDAQIELAKQGKFNNIPVGRREGGAVRDFMNGYADNYYNNFSPDNWGGQKSVANRVGEAFGSLGKFVDSPVGRGVLAAGTIAALGGGAGDALGYGLQAGVGRQQYRAADKLYRNQLEAQGINTSDIQGNITSDMYKNVSLNAYRNNKLTIQREAASAKDNTARAKIILNAFEKNMLSEEDAIEELQKYGITIDELEASNSTRKTNIAENESNHKIALIDAKTEQAKAYSEWLRNRGKGGVTGGGTGTGSNGASGNGKKLPDGIVKGKTSNGISWEVK